MKIVNIKGGLGNQMFQYAFACKLKRLYPNEKILLDLTDFKGYGWHVYELKYVFDVQIPVANPLQICKFRAPISINDKGFNFLRRILHHILRRNNYDEKESDLFSFNSTPFGIDTSCYYNGYWCNERYFSDIKEDIRNVFSFKRPLSEYNQNVKVKIENNNSVSIHVRRGNYLLFDEYKDICERPYYEKAIQYIKEHVENPHFYVFSNDMQWCKDNLGDLLDNYTFVENNDPQNNYVDMQLMSCCKHNIIAHSTFSWWGAWLNQNSEKIVIAPSVWNNNFKAAGPQLEDWVLISNKD